MKKKMKMGSKKREAQKKHKDHKRVPTPHHFPLSQAAHSTNAR